MPTRVCCALSPLLWGIKHKIKVALSVRYTALWVTVSCLRPAAGTPQSFKIHLASLQDVVLKGEPSWWTPERTLSLTVFLTMATLGILGWVVILRHQARSQTALIQSALKATADGIVVVDEHERIVNYNIQPQVRRNVAHSSTDSGLTREPAGSRIRAGAIAGPESIHGEAPAIPKRFG